MKELLKKNLSFFVPYFTFLSVSFILILSYEKAELHILSNEINNHFLDYFFKFVTNLGDGVMIAVLAVILLFVKYRYSIAFVVGSLVTSGVVQLLKKVVLHDIYRPSKYFELYETYHLHFVEGVNLHSLHSFPSGHSATAFNIFLMLALIFKNQTLKVLFILSAVVVAYSRVYLSQHFLIDITVGSLFGVLITLVVFWWSTKWRNEWFEKSLIELFISPHDK